MGCGFSKSAEMNGLRPPSQLSRPREILSVTAMFRQ
jgi:hypothetical protein